MQNQSAAEGSKRPASEDGASNELASRAVVPIGLRFALVGPGKVGASLCRWLIESGGRLELLSGLRADSPRLEELIELGRGSGDRPMWCPVTELTTEGLDLLLIAVSDPALRQVAAALAERPQAKVALHVAGQFDAEILAPLRAAGCRIGSMHPLRAFVDPERSTADPPDSVNLSADFSADSPSGIWFGIDGDPEARELAEALVARWGGSSANVTGDQRAIYHLAATLAAGGVTTLLAVVEELLEVANLPPSLLDAYLGLTRGALSPIERSGGVAGKITGPAARGDLGTLRGQRAVLAATAPHLLPLIEMLQEETLRRCGWESLEGPGHDNRRGDTARDTGRDSGGDSARAKIPPPAEGKTE